MSFSSSKTGAPPPPPPPPPPVAGLAPINSQAPKTPVVPATGPVGAFMVHLLVYNGAPFKDHWAYWVPSHEHQDVGVFIHAAGDVRNGFKFEIKRNYDFRATASRPDKWIPLQWVCKDYFDEKAMLNYGDFKVDDKPVCEFEASVHKVKAPGKTLKAVDDKATQVGKKIIQRNCQTWIIESANQLVKDRIFSQEVATYLHAISQ